ncbi:MAG: hypothetical protein JWL77_1671 [Chthonomonadaceae bacterium]|nr:hypothetical protein [Chthonomonadaceae bacterium]
MMRRIGMMILVLCAITSTHTTREQEKHGDVGATHIAHPIIVPAGDPQATDIEMATVPINRPIEVTDPQGLPTLMRRYVIVPSTTGYSFSRQEDPNPIYRKARPFPEVHLESIVPSSPWGVSGNEGGLLYVEAFRLHWPWPPPDPRTISKPETQTLWHWDVRKAQQNQLKTWAPEDAGDRYCAVCLYSDFEIAKRDSQPTDPQLFYFDMLNGLRWQTTIPVDRAVEDIPTTNAWSGHWTDVQVGLVPGGSRVLALVSRPDKEVSLLFVFDVSGKLLRTERFPRYETLGSGSGWDLRRTPSGQTYLLHLQGFVGINPRITLLVDTEGSVLSRFENDGKMPVDIMTLTDKYAVGSSQRSGNHYAEFIYQLPLSVGVEANNR